jgi:uncharacterized protein
MSSDIFDYSVPVFLRGHGILAELLKKAESYAAERKIAPAVLLTARLFPDIYPLTGQVQAACDTAKRATARLVGVEAPRFEDNEVSFDELYARIRKTTEFVESHLADAFLAAADRTIEMKMGSGTVSLMASQYLTRFALPNFYFHVTTSSAITAWRSVSVTTFAIWPRRCGEARLLRLLLRARSADHETLPKTVTYRRRRMRRPIRWYNAMARRVVGKHVRGRRVIPEKTDPAWIRVANESQSMIQCDVCDHLPAWNIYRRSVQVAAPA